MSTTYEDEVAAQMRDIRRRDAEDRRTAGIPFLPGTGMADDLAPFIEQLTRMTADRRTLGSEVSDLTRQRRTAERDGTRALATAMRSGERVEDPPSLQSIDEAIAAKRRRMDAITLAEKETREEVHQLVGANAIGYQSEVDARRRALKVSVSDAIDNLEVAWDALFSADIALDWVRRGGEGKPSVRAVALNVPREPNLAHVLTAMRAAVEAERPELRPTHDPDGTPRTGWDAWGKLASGERAVGAQDRRVTGR